MAMRSHMMTTELQSDLLFRIGRTFVHILFACECETNTYLQNVYVRMFVVSKNTNKIDMHQQPWKFKQTLFPNSSRISHFQRQISSLEQLGTLTLSACSSRAEWQPKRNGYLSNKHSIMFNVHFIEMFILDVQNNTKKNGNMA